MKYFSHSIISIFTNSILPIILGIIIYALFRGLYFIDPTGKFFPLLSNDKIPSWLLYNLPDALWLYAILSTMVFIWGNKYKRELLIWFVLIAIGSIVTEFFQLYNIIPGTFDSKDILSYIIATLICALKFKIIKINIFQLFNNYHYENN